MLNRFLVWNYSGEVPRLPDTHSGTVRTTMQISKHFRLFTKRVRRTNLLPLNSSWNVVRLRKTRRKSAHTRPTKYQNGRWCSGIEQTTPSQERDTRVDTEWFHFTWSSRTGKTNSSWKSSQQTFLEWGEVLGASGSVTGKGHKETDRNVLDFDPYLPHSTCKSKF